MVMKVIRKARNEGVRVERVIKMPLIRRPNGGRAGGRTIMGAAFVVRKKEKRRLPIPMHVRSP